jgi:hypothetical protein
MTNIVSQNRPQKTWRKTAVHFGCPLSGVYWSPSGKHLAVTTPQTLKVISAETLVWKRETPLVKSDLASLIWDAGDKFFLGSILRNSISTEKFYRQIFDKRPQKQQILFYLCVL